ncbi:hypothetical protein [Paracoccus actinidiae]|uniref:hypothetical protein n=1 Tax=Paracoccus actinidiae TaxID=3064531 RepID=UPI0027D2D5B9|nr:hypothetical protein [Paracoccus sp. M09]
MSAWEAANPGLLELASIRGFFGAPNVASGKLSKKTSIHYVPAVADAGEETFGAKKSPIINLLSEIERQVYENQREVVDFISRSQTEFSDLVNPDRFPQLASISERLTSTVQRYYRDSKLMADWKSKDGLKVSFP